MADRDRIEQRETTEGTHRADLPPYPNGDTGMGPDRGSPPSTPRWVKVFAIIAIVLILLFAILQFTSGGDHGPRRHSPSGADLGGRISYSSVAEDHTASGCDLGSHTPLSSFTEYGEQRL